MIHLILHNIRSAHNVGAIFRTADAVGVEKIFLTGYTPVPIDRFGRVRKDIHKSALGAEETVKWGVTSDVGSLLCNLREEGYEIIALEQDEKSIIYDTFEPKANFALIVGNEVRGLSKQILNKCDKIIEIPMCGKKESLNVSVAVGIALYQIASAKP